LNKVGCTCKNPAITVSGAMWLGKLHDVQQLKRYQTLAQQWHWQKIVKLLQLMEGEIDFPPYFYTLGEIGNRGKLDLPKRSHLIRSLQDQGYQAAPTHISPQGIKTNAQMGEIIAIAKNI
jgi:tRNA (guanine26-N2/guanine27-N2)-dimethyltransferase